MATLVRLMKGMGIEGVIRGKPHQTTIPDYNAPCPLDKVNRQFRVPAPNRLWVSDFTYVAFVIDAYPLPVFPALAMLAADRFLSSLNLSCGLALGALAVAVIGLAVLASLIAVLTRDRSFNATALVMVAGGLVSAALFARQLVSGHRIRALGAMLLLAAAGHWATLTVTLQTPWLWPSAAVARQITDLPPCPGRLLVVAGFNEPSMAFSGPIPVAFVDAQTAATVLATDPCVIGLIEQQLLPDLIATGAIEIGDTVEGFAIGSGRRVSIAIVLGQYS